MNKYELFTESISLLVGAQAEGNRLDEGRILKLILKPKYLGQGQKKVPAEYLFFSKIAFGVSECWYWIGGINHLGYGVLGKVGRAHRVAWSLLKGPIPKGMSVLHRCDIRCCVNPDHLFLGTQLDNMRDCAAKGRIVAKRYPGETNPCAKLTYKLVEEMKLMRQQTRLSYKKIAVKFNVSVMTAFRACTGRSWSI